MGQAMVRKLGIVVGVGALALAAGGCFPPAPPSGGGGGGGGGPSSGTQTFNCTGVAQPWQVPAGVTSITVDAFGAQGGTAADPYPGNAGVGGRGGSAAATIAVTPLETLQVYVGCAGGNGGTPLLADGGPGGFNAGDQAGDGDGGDGPVVSDPGGGGGGGASDVRQGGSGFAQRVIVAGGGGGGGASDQPPATSDGGSGGGLSGGDTATGDSGNPHPFAGGTQSAGGGAALPANDGSLGRGGPGISNNCCVTQGGGGGGGYYGGGGGDIGGHHATGGGGGSGFGPAGVIFLSGAQAGDGRVVITW